MKTALTRRTRPGFRPRLEMLEDRLTPSNGWGFGIGGTGWEDVRASTTDADGNTYLAGKFSNTVDFDPGLGVGQLSASDGSVIVAKYDSDGDLAWVRQMGGDGGMAWGVSLDGSGCVFVSGEFSGTAAFGSTNLTSAGGTDAYLVKLDSGGNFSWAKRFGGSGGNDRAFEAAVDASGHIWLTGFFQGTVSFGSQSFTSAGNEDIFLANLDSTGDARFARRMGGTGQDWGIGVDTDPDDNAYVTGFFSNTADFGGSQINLSGGGGIYVAKWDASGEVDWVKAFGSDDWWINERGTHLVVDSSAASASDWKVLVVGTTIGLADFDGDVIGSTSDNSFVAKLSAADGQVNWARSLGGTGQEMGYDLAIDGNGSIYSAGVFGTGRRPADFDPGTGVRWLTPPTDAYRAGYISRLDSDGNFTGAWQLGSDAWAYGVGADSSGAIYVVGLHKNASTLPYGHSITNAGYDDFFVLKLVPDLGEVSGRLFNDFDNDSVWDNSEPPLQDWTVYLDQNQNGTYDFGERLTSTNSVGQYAFDQLAAGTYVVRQMKPSGWTRTTPGSDVYSVTLGTGAFVANKDFGNYTPTTVYSFTNGTDVTVPELKWVSSSVSVGTAHTIFDVNVTASVTHAKVEDLIVRLNGPDGTTVNLYNSGATGANFTNTVFDDEASKAISQGTAPFSGSFKPLDSLAAFDSKNAKGTWKLEILDNVKNNKKGKLTDWTLSIRAATSTLLTLNGENLANPAAETLTADQLQPLLNEAIHRWQVAGADVSGLSNLIVEIADLTAGMLGMAGSNTIWLDANAAGYGWFVDPTPFDDSEFTQFGNQGEQGRMDLLTALTHELGHILGHEHDDGGVMAEYLNTGERETSGIETAVDQLFAFSPPFAKALDRDAFLALAGVPNGGVRRK